MNISIVTLGCKTNQFESAAMQNQLEDAGYRVVPFDEGAELVLVNTCTVTANTDSQSRKLIRRARRLNSSARIIVTGCYAQIDPTTLSKMPGVSLVIGNEEKADFLELLKSGEGKGTFVSDIRQIEEARPLPLQQFAEKSRAFVQIQNGCDAFCSYCIIPYARGRSRSVLPEDVVSQVQLLVDGGYSEVVLTGIHIGGYGKDLSMEIDLYGLVRLISEKTTLPRLRLGSIEPNELTPQLIDFVSSNSTVCPHFHMPLQSGSDSVLQRMNRDYSTAQFENLISRIVTTIPGAAIGLDVIVGFPGETDAEFKQTLELLQRTPFAFLHVFPYSRRPGTPAASMPEQVDGAIVKDRAAQLRQLAEAKEAAFLKTFGGTTQQVVALNGSKGLTAHYLTVPLPAGEYRPGGIYSILLP